MAPTLWSGMDSYGHIGPRHRSDVRSGRDGTAEERVDINHMGAQCLRNPRLSLIRPRAQYGDVSRLTEACEQHIHGCVMRFRWPEVVRLRSGTAGEAHTRTA